METSNCVEFNEPLSEEPSSMEICRLKSGLNTSCLLKVFDYLSIDDLMQVCNVDKYFEELIINWTIRKKTIPIDFGCSQDNLYNSPRDDGILQIFQKFGKSIRKLKLSGQRNFARWLEMIMEYCEPATLTEVEFTVHCMFKDVNQNVMQVVHQSMPFFANLQKLVILQHLPRYDDEEIYTEFLTCISATATNLRNLEIRQAPLKLGWLKNIKNLHELLIILNRKSVYDLDNCWGSNPKLKVFRFVGHQNISTVGDVLSKYFTGLTRFSDVNSENPYNQFGADIIERYNFLSTFIHLNTVTLTSYTFCGCDIYYPLMTLATKKIITLKVYMNYKRPIVLSEKEKDEIMRRPLPQFFYLQTVEIRLSEDMHTVDDNELADCNLRCQFMFRFLAQLKNLQSVKFCGDFLVNLYKVLEHAPQLRTLHISSGVELYEIQNIAKTLRKIRKSNDGDLLNLILNDSYSETQDCYREPYTKELDKLKDIVKISFKGPTIYIVTHTSRVLTHMMVAQ